MTTRPMYINAHGDDYHFICLCIGTKICMDRKYEFKNDKWLKEKTICPGEPDIYYFKSEKGWKDGRRCVVPTWWVIEIETNPSAASIEKKQQQFEETTKDHRLQIINVGKFDDKHDWKSVWKQMDIWIP